MKIKAAASSLQGLFVRKIAPAERTEASFACFFCKVVIYYVLSVWQIEGGEPLSSIVRTDFMPPRGIRSVSLFGEIFVPEQRYRDSAACGNSGFSRVLIRQSKCKTPSVSPEK